jgi:hypothetical protein
MTEEGVGLPFGAEYILRAKRYPSLLRPTER